MYLLQNREANGFSHAAKCDVMRLKPAPVLPVNIRCDNIRLERPRKLERELFPTPNGREEVMEDSNAKCGHELHTLLHDLTRNEHEMAHTITERAELRHSRPRMVDNGKLSDPEPFPFCLNQNLARKFHSCAPEFKFFKCLPLNSAKAAVGI